MRQGKRNHSAQFKVKVALEAVKGMKSIAELASQYEVHPTQIGCWKKQFLAALPEIFSDRRRSSSEDCQAENARLYEQIGRLQMELDWLKKKTGWER